MSQHFPAHFVAAAESYFAGQRVAEVRALSFNDIARIASGDAPLVFDAFEVNDDGNLVPVVVNVETYGTVAKVNTTFGVDAATGRLDRSKPVGARLTLFISEADGIGETRGHLFTTKAAEKAAVFGDGKSAKATRKSLWLPLDSEVFDADSTGKVTYKPLVEFHGSKVNASFVVEGVAPSVLEEKIRRFVAEEFGAAQGGVVSVEAHPVLDKRVDVFHPITGEEIARGILAAEIDLLPESEMGVDICPAADSTDD
jgi:hypothetical protein